jgi:Flp pilus assembly protein TadB
MEEETPDYLHDLSEMRRRLASQLKQQNESGKLLLLVGLVVVGSHLIGVKTTFLECIIVGVLLTLYLLLWCLIWARWRRIHKFQEIYTELVVRDIEAAKSEEF